MNEELKPDEIKAFQELADVVAKELNDGVPKEKIAKKIAKQSKIEEDVAMQFVLKVEAELQAMINSPEGRREIARQYKKSMIYGALWTIGGTLVTILTYSGARGGGRYVIAWGAIVFGLIGFFKGLSGWMKFKDTY